YAENAITASKNVIIFVKNLWGLVMVWTLTDFDEESLMEALFETEFDELLGEEDELVDDEWEGMLDELLDEADSDELKLPKLVRPARGNAVRRGSRKRPRRIARSRMQLPGTSYKPRVLTYTTRDVIDKRISVPAQHSLVRLSKNHATNASAVFLLKAVKSGILAGIYCANWKLVANRAKKLGKTWWRIIPKEEDAVLILNPDKQSGKSPIIAFRRELDSRNEGCGSLKNNTVLTVKPQQLDIALLKTASILKLWMDKKLTCYDSNFQASAIAKNTLLRVNNIIPSLKCTIKSNNDKPFCFYNPAGDCVTLWGTDPNDAASIWHLRNWQNPKWSLGRMKYCHPGICKCSNIFDSTNACTYNREIEPVEYESKQSVPTTSCSRPKNCSSGNRWYFHEVWWIYKDGHFYSKPLERIGPCCEQPKDAKRSILKLTNKATARTKNRNDGYLRPISWVWQKNRWNCSAFCTPY
ncbi:MAG: hypothetical protein D3909_10825, partial [Candidatus Electrothrix sp. ATG1]|nr:hypothetical protein [Candidatus Electrothrix sp. ATG1]